MSLRVHLFNRAARRRWGGGGRERSEYGHTKLLPQKTASFSGNQHVRQNLLACWQSPGAEREKEKKLTRESSGTLQPVGSEAPPNPRSQRQRLIGLILIRALDTEESKRVKNALIFKVSSREPFGWRVEGRNVLCSLCVQQTACANDFRFCCQQ